MKYVIKLGCLLLFLILASSCLGPTTKRPGQDLEDEDKRAGLILRKAHSENESSRYFHARELVRPLLEHKTVGREAKLLMKEIEFNIQFRNIRREQDLSAKVALNEVEKRLLLPDSMNQKRIYVPQVGPFKVERGPAEELLNKPINVDLENADIAGVLEALRQVEGLSFIADEGIETTNTLTIKINKVPLRDVLGYIERNMGLMFHVTKDVVWVMQSGEDEEGPKGPNLETKIIHLKKGYFPSGSGSSSSGGSSGSSRGGATGGGRNQPGMLGSSGGNAGGGGSSSGEDDLLDALDAFFADDGVDKPEGAKFQIFRNRNILVIRDSRENIRMVQELIDAFDRDPMQVVIETRFITVSKADLFSIGTQIGDTRSLDEDRLRYERAIQDGIDPDDPDDVSAIQNYLASNGIKSIAGKTLTGLTEGVGNLSLSGVLDDFTFDLTISALESLESTRTLEAPRITVVNNHPARIRNGKTFKYFEEFESGTSETLYDEANNPIGEQATLVPQGRPSEIEEGLTLEVVPSIGNDGKSVSMNIVLDQTNVSEFTTEVTAQGSYTLPSPETVEISTTVVVGSGETVVLGGTIRHDIVEVERKVPLLGDIPLLGWLFKFKKLDRRPNHLIVFITAHILDIDGRQKLAVEKEDAAREAAKVLANTSLNPRDLLKDNPDPTDLSKAAQALRDAGIDPANILKGFPEDSETSDKPEAPKPSPLKPSGSMTEPRITLPETTAPKTTPPTPEAQDE